jgi:hypothetical protein
VLFRPSPPSWEAVRSCSVEAGRGSACFWAQSLARPTRESRFEVTFPGLGACLPFAFRAHFLQFLASTSFPLDERVRVAPGLAWPVRASAQCIESGAERSHCFLCGSCPRAALRCAVSPSFVLNFGGCAAALVEGKLVPYICLCCCEIPFYFLIPSHLPVSPLRRCSVLEQERQARCSLPWVRNLSERELNGNDAPRARPGLTWPPRGPSLIPAALPLPLFRWPRASAGARGLAAVRQSVLLLAQVL